MATEYHYYAGRLQAIVDKRGEYMEGFGLAPVKQEGEGRAYDGESVDTKDHKRSKTRWIEMCYDPDEDMSHLDLEPFREVFQTQKLCNSYTEDDIYLIVKALANEFVEVGGY